MSSLLVPDATLSVTCVHVFHGPLPAFCTLSVNMSERGERENRNVSERE